MWGEARRGIFQLGPLISFSCVEAREGRTARYSGSLSGLRGDKNTERTLGRNGPWAPHHGPVPTGAVFGAIPTCWKTGLFKPKLASEAKKRFQKTKTTRDRRSADANTGVSTSFTFESKPHLRFEGLEKNLKEDSPRSSSRSAPASSMQDLLSGVASSSSSVSPWSTS